MGHTAAITKKSKRRKNDAYFTPKSAVQCLLEHVDIKGSCLEPCAGEQAIVDVLVSQGIETNHTDIQTDPANDATSQTYWDNQPDIDWVITNPPFNVSSQILPLAYEKSRVGVAFLLRLSYLEPCENRGTWLAKHPVNKLIIMPRISFTCNGRVDSCTTAWFVWLKNVTSQQIIVVPKN